MTLSKPDLFKFTCKTAMMVTDLIMKIIIVSLIPFVNGFFSQLRLKFRFAFENYNQISKYACRKEEGES